MGFAVPARKLALSTIRRVALVLPGVEARDHLMQADPCTFFITDHYRNYPSVLARLDRLTATDLGKLLGRAIEHATTKRR